MRWSIVFVIFQLMQSCHSHPVFAETLAQSQPTSVKTEALLLP